MLKGKFGISLLQPYFNALCVRFFVFILLYRIKPLQTDHLKFCIVKTNQMFFIALFPDPSYIPEGTIVNPWCPL